MHEIEQSKHVASVKYTKNRKDSNNNNKQYVNNSPMIDCNGRLSSLMTADEKKKMQIANIFSMPAINGSGVRELFLRRSKIRPLAAVDWAIIQDASINSMDQNEEVNEHHLTAQTLTEISSQSDFDFNGKISYK